MGFYENVFEILHRCYRDLRISGRLPPSKGAWWNGVLHGLDEIFFSEPPLPGSTDDEWIHWHVPLGPNEQIIGGAAAELPSVKQLVVGAFRRFLAGANERMEAHPDLRDDLLDVDIKSVSRLDARTDSDAKRGALVGRIERILRAGHALFKLDEKRNHQWFVALYFAGLNLIGILKDVLPNESSFRETLDVLDYKDWLADLDFPKIDARYHRDSAPVNAVYDLVFSRGSGFAAGTALYDTLLMLFHYKGHIFYKMAGGMGDVIFAPMYLWLKEKGVHLPILS